MSKLTIKDVRKRFKDEGCELLEKIWINSQTKMKFRCDCGRTGEVTLNSFSNVGQRCKECGSEKKSSKLRLLYKDVKKYFEDHDCELVSKEYKNNSTILDYICNCGDPAKITFACFKRGSRCRKCGIKKRTGPNSKKWNHNLTKEEREIGRNYPEYREWRKKVYRKNYWNCVCCKKKNGVKICAHHIESYDLNEELRLVVSNGVVFCEECHDFFHDLYGYGNNTREQFNEFMKIGVV